MADTPLAEVFGYLIEDDTDEAKRYRTHRLCPFYNRVPNCTKDKANNPLGVCSIYHESEPVITCPVRFREDWMIAEHAAQFFFREGMQWTSLTEVRLNDAHGKCAGNIDVVLVAYDEQGQIVDFGALEIQAVYISGNVRKLFEDYIQNPREWRSKDWSKSPNYPRPDYLSSSRKRLVPQLMYKGGILHTWRKKIAVALNKSFYSTLPPLKEVPKEKADIAWFLYDLVLRENRGRRRYFLTKVGEVFTEFEPALASITTPSPGKMEDFLQFLQERLDERLETPPTNQTIERPF